jgi:hypothetical protein
MEFIEKTRGFRNNNPGNIRVGNDWKGEIKGDDSEFEVFAAVEYGIRAIYKLTATFANHYNLKSIEEFLQRYAPPIENNTKSYINTVYQYMIDHADNEQAAYLLNNKTAANIHEHNLLPLFIGGIILMENGFQPFNFEFIKDCEDL